MKEETIFGFPKAEVVDENKILNLELNISANIESSLSSVVLTQDEINKSTHTLEALSSQKSSKTLKFVLLNDEDHLVESVFHSFPASPMKEHNDSTR